MKKFDSGKIKQYRLEVGLSQDKLASLLSEENDRVWTQQISQWEQGDKGMTVTNLSKIATALGKTTDDFFVEDAPEKK